MHTIEIWWGKLLVDWAAFSWTIACLIFLAYIVLDVLYVRYTCGVTQLKPAQAANNGSVMYFLLAFGVFNYVTNPLYLLPLFLGSWIGTYFAVNRERKKRQKEKA